MFQGQRSIENNFGSDELLYRRFCPDEVLGDRLAPDSIKFPDWSVNRQKYSQPEDVQFPSGSALVYLCCGVAGFSVSDIPSKIDPQGVYTFVIEHKPELDNYAHSELVTYKNGRAGKEIPNFKIGKNKSEKEIKKTFRTMLSDKTKIIVQPNPTFDCIKNN
jgi:hypothetical protein